MNDTVTIEEVAAVAIERNAMTGDYRCKLCDAIWSGSASPWHKGDCLLRSSRHTPQTRVESAIGQLAIELQQLSRRVLALESTMGCIGVDTWNGRATPR